MTARIFLRGVARGFALGYWIGMMLASTAVKADPVITKLRPEAGKILLEWDYSRHPPEGGYDIIFNGNDPGTWRQDKLEYEFGPIDLSTVQCFEIEARWPTTNEFFRSDTACYDPDIEAGPGKAVLKWTAPTEREDGSELDNLARYVIYIARPGETFTKRAQVPAGTETYTAFNLGVGEWNFVVTAEDAEGRESKYSNVGSKVIVVYVPKRGTLEGASK